MSDITDAIVAKDSSRVAGCLALQFLYGHKGMKLVVDFDDPEYEVVKSLSFRELEEIANQTVYIAGSSRGSKGQRIPLRRLAMSAIEQIQLGIEPSEHSRLFQNANRASSSKNLFCHKLFVFHNGRTELNQGVIPISFHSDQQEFHNNKHP